MGGMIWEGGGSGSGGGSHKAMVLAMERTRLKSWIYIPPQRCTSTQLQSPGTSPPKPSTAPPSPHSTTARSTTRTVRPAISISYLRINSRAIHIDTLSLPSQHSCSRASPRTQLQHSRTRRSPSSQNEPPPPGQGSSISCSWTPRGRIARCGARGSIAPRNRMVDWIPWLHWKAC